MTEARNPFILKHMENESYVSVQLNRELMEEYERRAKTSGIPVRELIDRALENYIEQIKKAEN